MSASDEFFDHSGSKFDADSQSAPVRSAACIIAMSVELRKMSEAGRRLSLPLDRAKLNFEQGHPLERARLSYR